MKKFIFFLLLILQFTVISESYALQIYAHRGGRGIVPENTMPAYHTSLALGVDFVDMDINMTKDGVIVVTHNFALNPDITRDTNGKFITDKNILIKSLTLEELKKYDVGKIKPGTQYAKLFHAQYSIPHTPIPTLKEVIHYVKKNAGNKVKFQIEIKTDPTHPDWTYMPEKLAQSLAKILKDEGIIGRTEVQAFDWRCLLAIQKINPKIHTAYLTDGQLSKAMRSNNPKVAGLWTAGKLLKDYDYSIPKMIAKLGGKIWGAQEIELNQANVNEAHKHGLKVVPWPWPQQAGIDFNEPLIVKLMSYGVDGIITDRPDILRGLMAARDMALPKAIIPK